jgi:hypothetical protein
MTSDKRATEQMFEGLSSLYQEDPEKFEEQRKLLIAQTIESFPEGFFRKIYGSSAKFMGQLYPRLEGDARLIGY